MNFVAGWSDLDASLANGLTPITIPSGTKSLLARYEFLEGPMTGFNFGWQYSGWGSAMMDAGRTRYITPSGNLHHLLFGYRGENWRVNARVGNVFDDFEIYANRFETAVGVAEFRNYRLQFTFDF